MWYIKARESLSMRLRKCVWSALHSLARCLQQGTPRSALRSWSLGQRQVEAVYDIADVEVSSAFCLIRAQGYCVAHNCNFALLYGASDSKVADTITQGGNAVTKLDVRFIFDDFYDNNPELKEWMQECMDRADETHCAFTPFGRVRDLSDFYERGDIAGARRRAINTPIQGGCGDWLKLCLPQIDKLLVEEYPGKAFVTMLIHDELVVDIDESDEELMWEIVARIRSAMVNEPLRRKVGWPVPLAVDIEGGYTWS